jgi:hypothetical protein
MDFNPIEYIAKRMSGFNPASYLQNKYQQVKQRIASDPEMNVYFGIGQTGAQGLKSAIHVGREVFNASSPLAYAMQQAGNPQGPPQDLLSQIGHMPQSLAMAPIAKKGAAELVELYTSKAGLPQSNAGKLLSLDKTRASRIAEEYEKLQHNPADPAVQSAYNALVNETLEQFKVLKESGLKIKRIKPGMKNPYPNGSKDVIKDITENNTLWFYPTESGFGSGEAASHPLLAKTAEMHEGKPLLANDVFRIVHDYFGHTPGGHSFGPLGEENAWNAHMRMFSPEAQKALTTETRGQNSWVNFGPHGEANRANPANTKYAEQKAGLLPDWVMSDVTYREEPIKLVHYSPKEGLTHIDPAKMGTGIRSEEYRRGLPEVPRSNYYREGTEPETIVTGAAKSQYITEIPESSLYDLNTDKEGLVKKALESNQGAWNPDLIYKEIKNAGYKGLHNSGSRMPGTVHVFEALPVKSSKKLP